MTVPGDALTVARAAPRGKAVEPGAVGPPPRPPAWQEAFSSRLLRALSPRLRARRSPAPPARLAPYESFTIERPGRLGGLAATWYPVAGPGSGKPRGAVLLAHPWIEWGQGYFHRRGRIETLRRAGYGVLTFDLPGVGGSAPPRGRFLDRDFEDALAELRGRARDRPIFFWGVSAGATWGHMLLSRADGVAGAFFEDVPPHFIEWSRRAAPWGEPCYRFFERVFALSYRFLDLRRHAPHLRLRAAAYVGGERDRGMRPGETRELARRARAECLMVPDAGHLEAIKRARGQVLALALETFERARRR